MRRVLDLCVDEEGVIWCYSQDRGMLRAGRSMDQFAQTDVWKRSTDLRVTHFHRDLCWEVASRLALYQRQWVCSAHVAWGSINHSHFERLVSQSRLEVPISVGGWRQATAEDVLLWSILRGERPIAAIEQHPVWPVVSFFNPSGHMAAAVLAGLIIDPRFCVDPQHPDSPRWLYQKLCLRCHMVRRARECVMAGSPCNLGPTWLDESQEEASVRALACWISGLGLWDEAVTECFVINSESRHRYRELASLRAFACLLRDGWMDAAMTSAREAWCGGAAMVSALQLSREKWLIPDRHFREEWVTRWRAHARRWQGESVC